MIHRHQDWLSQNRAKRTAVESLVVGHDELCKGMIAVRDTKLKARVSMHDSGVA